MKVLFMTVGHLLYVILRLMGPRGKRTLIAENLLLKQQMIVLNRGRCRAPNVPSVQRMILGFLSSLIPKRRLIKVSVSMKPSTIFKLHQLFVNRKYRDLFSSKVRKKPGPKGPERELIDAVVEFKRRNPRCGYIRIAQQLSITFNIEIDQYVVRRILAKHYKPTAQEDGPSWLTLMGQSKDSLWSVDFFRTESIHLKSHWVMVVMDQYSRNIIGFAVQSIVLDGNAICRMFGEIIKGRGRPKRLSSDNDPLFQVHQWEANLRIMEIESVKSIPYIPVSHPFVERLIGTIRREFLDHTFYWNETDLLRKLNQFKDYYNVTRVHQGIEGKTPRLVTENLKPNAVDLNCYRWKSHCNGLFKMPEAA